MKNQNQPSTSLTIPLPHPSNSKNIQTPSSPTKLYQQITHSIISNGSTPHLNPRYIPIKLIYEALVGYTKVTLLKDPDTQQILVLKQMMKQKMYSQYQKDSAWREVHIASSINHQNLVKVYDAGELEDSFVILMEFVPDFDYFTQKIELNNKPYNLKPDGDIYKLKAVTSQILGALCYLHKLGFIHMDLKPSNILRTSDGFIPTIKLIDFGLSRIVDQNGVIQLERKCGTDLYLAPEVKDKAFVTPAVDMWSFGILIYQLTVGYVPAALKWEVGDPVPFHRRHWTKYANTGLKELIESCLEVVPDQRITSKAALSHPWFMN